MANFILAYHGGGMPETEEEGARLMERWSSWLNGLGAAVVDPGNPVGKSKTLSKSGVTDDGGSNPLSGFSVVEAESIDGAIELARGCPHLDNGTIEIAEIIKM